MAGERSRRQLLEDAGLGALAQRINVSGTPTVAAREVVDRLCRHGRIAPEQEALEALLLVVRELVGLDGQAFLDRLLTKEDDRASNKTSYDTKPSEPRKRGRLQLPNPAVYSADIWVERPMETAKLVAALQGERRVVIISGISGIGKTALAERAIAELLKQQAVEPAKTHASTHRWCRLNLDDGIVTGNFAESGVALLRAIGEEPTLDDRKEPRNLLRHLVKCLSESRLWVQIDSLEHLLVEGNRENRDRGSAFEDELWLAFFQQILARPECGSQLLVTTQEVPKALLAVGSRYPQFWYWQELVGLREEEQLALFARLGVLGEGVKKEMDKERVRLLQRIGQLYEGHPLVLRVIAEDIKGIAVAGGDMRRYWQRCGLDRLETHQTVYFSRLRLQVEVRDRLEASLQGLPQVALQLLLRGAVYRRPVPEEFWLALLPEVRNAKKIDALNLLKLRGLALEVWDENAWYGADDALPVRQHNLIRQVACEMLRREPEIWQQTQRQAAEQWLAGYAPREGVERLETVRGYLEAFDHYCDGEDWERAKGILLTPLTIASKVSLPRQLEFWSYYQEGIRICKSFLNKSTQDTDVSCLKLLGNYFLYLGNYRQAIDFYQKSLEIAREINDRTGEGVVLGNLGNAYYNLGEYQRTLAFHRQSLEIAREIGNRTGEGIALGNLGLAYQNLGEYQQAIAFHEQSLEIRREIGNRRAQGSALGNLGIVYQDLGEYRRAIFYHEQYLEIAREIGDRRGEGNALGNLGIAYKQLGECRRAIAFYEQALVISREIGDRRGEGNAFGNLGIAHKELGEYRRAITFFEQALAISREIGDRRGEGSDLGNLGIAHQELGEYRRAIAFYEQALAISREIGDRMGEGSDLGNLGNTQVKLKQYDKALKNLQASLTIFREIQSPESEARVLKMFAKLYLKTARLDEALEACTAALDIATELGIPLAKECEEIQLKIQNAKSKKEV